jgi:PAS domain S-box-containing protein
MAVSPESPSEEIRRLRRCINDLVSVLALPATWTGGAPSQVVGNSLDALVSMLSLDFIYARLRESTGKAFTEMVRVGSSWESKPRPEEVGEKLQPWLENDPEELPVVVRNLFGRHAITLVPVHLGPHAEIGVIVAGSQRADFPQQVERLVLNTAANQAVIGLQGSSLLSTQRRLSSELDQQVAQRTAELAAAEERWRSVFENSAVGVALTDLNGRFLAANPVYEEMLGYTEGELQQLSFLDITHEEDIEASRTFVAELLAGKRSQYQIEKQYRRKNGSLIWVRNNVSVVPGTELLPRFFMALSEDITERKHAEQALLASELNLRRVIDALPTLAWCNLPDGSNEFLNKRWHAYTGLSPEESHGWGWQAAFHPEDLLPLMKRWQELLISGEPGEIEARLRRYDDVYRWFLIRVEPLRDEEGKIVRWYGTSTDIEDRKRAEEERERLLEAQRIVVETASDAVVSIGESGAIQFANPATMRVFGYDPKEVIGKPLTMLMPEYLRELHKNGLTRYLATGQRHINWQGTELTGLHKNGEEFPVEISFGELTREGHKTFTGFIRDISKRKRAEQALRRSKSLLTESQHLSLTGSFSWKVATDEIRWSEQLYRIFESEPDAPITLDLIMSRIHPDDLPILNDIYDRARSGVGDLECDHRLLMPDGSVKYLHTVAHATGGEHGEREYMGASQDVTQRRLSEEALGRARSELAKVSRVTSLGVLTASIAHEVNQPLSGIITNAGTCLRMLSGDPPNVEGARETARRTIRDGNRASDVIARLRTLYSRKDLVPELMDLNETAREVTSLSLDELQRNRVILRHELADDLPVVTGDRIQLQQVILNLVRNASDAMSAVEDRPRQLVIRTERDEGDRVRLTVQDTGVGLDPQAADRLFDAFYTTKGDGMGIGLSVSRSIIEAHQGRLWATGNDGPGATFSFSIPCRRTSQDAPESRANRPDRAAGAT